MRAWFIIFLTIICVVFALQNAEIISVKMLFWSLELPIILVLLLGVVLGLILGILLTFRKKVNS